MSHLWHDTPQVAELLSPITAEDLAALAVVSDAQISPDGTRVAYPVRRMDVAGNRYRAAVHVVPFDGSAEGLAITDGDADASAPRWSPDGETIAFLSGGVPAAEPGAAKLPKPPKQVHLVPAAGGASRRLTDLLEDCSEPTWAPDGSGLVIVVKDRADPAQAGDGIRVYDRLRYKTDEGGLFDLRRKHLWWVPLEGAPRRITEGDWDDTQPALSPDGSEVAFVSNRSGERDRNTVVDLWVAGRDGGAPRRITNERGSYGNPSWSPDGRSITGYGVAQALGSQAANVRLWRFPASGGPDAQGIDLLGDWDRTVGSVVIGDIRGQAATLPPTWSRDGDRVYFVGSDQGAANLYSCAAAGGDVRAVTLGAHQVVSASIDAAVRRFVAVVATAVIPGEVTSGSLDAADLRRLTHLNDAFLATRSLAEPERVEFSGADGWAIEGWLLKPRGFDPAKRWPLVLEIHGGPHTTYGHSFFHEFQVLAGRGYAVLYTNPRGSHAYGERFVAACVGDWGGKDYQDLMAGVDHTLALGWVDPDRLYVTGGSYGGFMTNWIVGHTPRFKAAVTQRSISNNVSAFGTSDIGWHFWQHEMGDATPWRDGQKLIERSPLTYVTEIRTPLLILHAENDYRCPIEQAEQLFVALKVLDREATFVRFPDDTHELTRGGKPRNRIDHCRRIVDWFDAHP